MAKSSICAGRKAISPKPSITQLGLPQHQNTEDWLVQATFAEHLEHEQGWECVHAWNDETFGSDGTLDRGDTRDVVPACDLLLPRLMGGEVAV